jgi:hypothetical protein
MERRVKPRLPQQNKRAFHNQPSRFTAWRLFVLASPLFEIGLVLVRFDHVSRVIVNADHGII